MNPLISIIIPVYNVQSFLDDCLQSVLAQSYKNLEIILVDDGSTDASGDMCQLYAKQDSRIKVIVQKNAGMSAARNTGIEAAHGEFLCFIDSDDFVMPTMIATLFELLTEQGADVSVCGVTDQYKNKSTHQSQEQSVFTCSCERGFDLMLAGKKIAGSSCNKLFPRSLIGQHRYPLNRIYEDAIFQTDVLLHAGKWAVTTQPLYVYRHRPNSATTSCFSEKNLDVIFAYDYIYEQMSAHCPSAVAGARFRQLWARFVVLDKLISSKATKAYPNEYKSVTTLLKDCWYEICTCPYFEKSRKVAAVLLKLHVALYTLVVHLQNRRNELA